MKLYRHYKYKPYKYLGVVRHSETLEEMVLYETLYKNDKGKLWVRPKKMFEESVQVEGQSMPRFAHIDLEVKATEHIGSADLMALKPLLDGVFSDWNEMRFAVDLKERTSIYLLKAYIDQDLVGFQLGYESSLEVFHSWLSAVKAEFRNLGIGSDLMRRQHDWCRSKGYKKVQMDVSNSDKAMIILGLRNDYEFTGIKNDGKNGLKLIMEKKLN